MGWFEDFGLIECERLGVVYVVFCRRFRRFLVFYVEFRLYVNVVFLVFFG